MASPNAPPQQAMDELFGGDTERDVDYRARTRYTAEDIIVGDDDDLFEIAEKMRRARRIVEDGQSLAVVLGTLPPDSAPIDFNRLAKEAMTPQELFQYESWEGGSKLPPLDRERDRKPIPPTTGNRQRDERRLAFLRRVYKDEELAPENLAWFHANKSHLIPFLCAGAKVIGAERSKTDGGRQDPRDLAERSAAGRVAGTASARVQAIQAETNKLLATINAGVQTVQGRREAMRWTEGKAKPKKTPINDLRQAVGAPIIGAPRNWHREAAVGRAGRLGRGITTRVEAEEPQAGPSRPAKSTRQYGKRGGLSKELANLEVGEKRAGKKRRVEAVRPESPVHIPSGSVDEDMGE